MAFGASPSGCAVRLAKRRPFSTLWGMALPTQPVTLSIEQLEELNRRLATMRHDINNHLSLIMAAVELIRCKPQLADRMMATLAEQPSKISETVSKFSADFERALGISRPG